MKFYGNKDSMVSFDAAMQKHSPDAVFVSRIGKSETYAVDIDISKVTPAIVEGLAQTYSLRPTNISPVPIQGSRFLKK